MPVESPPRNTRGVFRPSWGAWGVSALLAIAAWAGGCGERQPPVGTRPIPALTLEVGNTESVDLAAYFSDPDGDVLSYTARSDDPSVATAAVSGATVQVTAVAVGGAQVWVTAADPGGLSAPQSPWVTVVNPPAAYLVQAVQSSDYPAPVVAGKEALLRVFVTATYRATAETTLPPAKATFYVDGSETYSVKIDGKPETIPTEVDEGSLARSLNVTIPASVIEEGLSVVVDIDPDSTIDAGLLASRRIPRSGELDLGVESVPGFELTVIPFLYTWDPDSSVLDHVDGMESEEEEHELLHDTYDLIPIEEMSVKGHDPVEIDDGRLWYVLDRTAAIRAAESGSGHWMGLIALKGEAGIAELPGTSSASTPNSRVMVHELGHNLNLWHAPCGVRGDDPGYPYDDGSIGAWGYDHRSGSLIDKDRAEDYMSYCVPVWVSDYHFGKAVRYRTAQARSHGEASGRTGPSLLVWGSRSAGAAGCRTATNGV